MKIAELAREVKGRDAANPGVRVYAQTRKAALEGD